MLHAGAQSDIPWYGPSLDLTTTPVDDIRSFFHVREAIPVKVRQVRHKLYIVTSTTGCGDAIGMPFDSFREQALDRRSYEPRVWRSMPGLVMLRNPDLVHQDPAMKFEVLFFPGYCAEDEMHPSRVGEGDMDPFEAIRCPIRKLKGDCSLGAFELLAFSTLLSVVTELDCFPVT